MVSGTHTIPISLGILMVSFPRLVGVTSKSSQERKKDFFSQDIPDISGAGRFFIFLKFPCNKTGVPEADCLILTFK